MKKVLVLLIACLASTVMFAQTTQTHWTQITTGEGVAGTNTTMTGMLYIDNVLYYNAAAGITPEFLEIGVFDQNGVCRAAKLPSYRASKDQWLYSLTIKGGEGFSYTFKIYDHESQQELDLVDNFGEIITWGSGKRYGSTGTPYVMNFSAPAQTIYKEITGYGEDEGHWYLISTPLGDMAPTDVARMTEGTFDLYYFDQNGDEGLEWITYRDNANFGNIATGKGYLYARQETDSIFFTGTPYDGEGTFPLDYVAGTDFAGWNLVGNPYTVVAYVDREFYVMNEAGTEIVAPEVDGIAAMEGIFVKATEEGENVTFSTQAPGKGKSTLALNLTQGRGVVDRAVVNFGQGNLPKFQLNPNSTKVYIPMEGTDYAVVSAEPMGEMPVNFKAQKSGDFTLNFKAENVGFNYLHLIDNLTGADQDLLANPSYAFNASTTDYESRFKLVYATGSDNGDNFAFFSNGAFIVSNDGEAVLQVVDLNGRILSSTTISGSTAVNVDAAAGVYMLRLLNGDNVKVQKVIIK